ncbi:MAG TPA: Flp family type IVb pilin [Thermopetrobacter sp.]|nr:Flp family type IVb pilin [Thermopetrobacter sp.]
MKAVSLQACVRRFLGDESGATAIEYALIATGTVFALIPFLPGFKNFMINKMSSIANAMSNN